MNSKTFGLIICFLIISMGLITACEHFAGYNESFLYSNNPTMNICNIDGCINENVHQHDGIYYSGHHNNDKHGHHHRH
jgi:hypothetical protein